MFNNSNNFALPMLQCHYLPILNQEIFPSMNYQKSFMASYFWMDQNFTFQPYQTFITYEPQNFIASQINPEDFKMSSTETIHEDINKIQKLASKD